jgi:DNA mismatch endonuclease (patch repair protein)
MTSDELRSRTMRAVKSKNTKPEIAVRRLVHALPSELRSKIMRAVKSRDTGPELIVRRLVHRLGFRFRLHRKNLPGKPDLVFIGKRKVIFVHGCFWHGHDCARGARIPKANRAYWLTKIGGNKLRDQRSIAALNDMGWKSSIVWECETNRPEILKIRLSSFLRGRHSA